MATEPTPGANADETATSGQVEGADAGISEGSPKDELFENATAEDLAAIEADPRLKKVRDSMVRDYKAKTAKTAEERRQIEAQREEAQQAVRLFDAIKDDPQSAIRFLADRYKVPLAEARAAVEEIVDGGAEQNDEEINAMFGDMAPQITPLFNAAVEKRARAIVREELGPVQQYLTEREQERLQGEIATSVGDLVTELQKQGEQLTPEMEKAMIALTNKIDIAVGPDGKPTMSTREYVDMIYHLASRGKTREQVTKQVARDIHERVKKLEPSDLPTGGVGSGSAITEGMSLRDSLAAVRPSVRTEMSRRR